MVIEQKMQFLITFLEGLMSFLSPCMLPLLPVYISYFGGNSGKKQNTVLCSICFVIGFSMIFCLLGLFAGTLGALLTRYQTSVNIICGMIVIVFGLSQLDIIALPFFRGMESGREVTGALSALSFGVIYALSLTPCVGAYLGSALMLASSAGSAVAGVLLLLVYSLGLGIPFVLSAMLVRHLEGVFRIIKTHYQTVNRICGFFLIAVGILIATGMLNQFMYSFI